MVHLNELAFHSEISSELHALVIEVVELPFRFPPLHRKTLPNFSYYSLFYSSAEIIPHRTLRAQKPMNYSPENLIASLFSIRDVPVLKPLIKKQLIYCSQVPVNNFKIINLQSASILHPLSLSSINEEHGPENIPNQDSKLLNEYPWLRSLSTSSSSLCSPKRTKLRIVRVGQREAVDSWVRNVPARRLSTESRAVLPLPFTSSWLPQHSVLVEGNYPILGSVLVPCSHT